MTRARGADHRADEKPASRSRVILSHLANQSSVMLRFRMSSDGGIYLNRIRGTLPRKGVTHRGHRDAPHAARE